jgi:hypothetical protein
MRAFFMRGHQQKKHLNMDTAAPVHGRGMGISRTPPKKFNVLHCFLKGFASPCPWLANWSEFFFGQALRVRKNYPLSLFHLLLLGYNDRAAAAAEPVFRVPAAFKQRGLMQRWREINTSDRI